MIVLCGGTIQYTDSGSSNPSSIWVNEIADLPDAILCKVREERNGLYELELDYLGDGVNATEIQSNRIIKCSVPLRNSIGDNYFRIYRVERGLSGHIIAYARQVTFDLSGYAVARQVNAPSAISVRTAQQYLNALRSCSSIYIPFSLVSDATRAEAHRMYFMTPESVRAYLCGEGLLEDDKTLLELYDGEFYYNGFQLEFLASRGTERSREIRYGSNIADIGVDDDLDDLNTTFILYWTGEFSDSAAPRAMSDKFSTAYASLMSPKVKMVDWSFFLQYDDPPAYMDVVRALNSAAYTYAETHSEEGNPVRRIDVDVIETEIGEVYLCDTLPVIINRYGIEINTRMKVIGYTWDVLLQRYDEITLGHAQQTLAKLIAKIANGG